MLEYTYTQNIFAVNAQDKYMYVGSNTPFLVYTECVRNLGGHFDDKHSSGLSSVKLLVTL